MDVADEIDVCAQALKRAEVGLEGPVRVEQQQVVRPRAANWSASVRLCPKSTQGRSCSSPGTPSSSRAINRWVPSVDPVSQITQ
jgi:hypothetical protein